MPHLVDGGADVGGSNDSGLSPGPIGNSGKSATYTGRFINESDYVLVTRGGESVGGGGGLSLASPCRVSRCAIA